ncbi:MAG: glycosyltransferase [Bacteroidales bacterium]|nr:glycosyltransferase [Bacteroidales bacterium]
MIKVSVIIPVYNVASFIRRNVHSLFSQTMEEVEFLFVNDATPDNSMDIIKEELEKFPQRKPFVRILDHEKNKGLPAARNTGLSVACGEYVYHCDSDDWVEPDMLQKMYDAASGKEADIVYCDFFLSFEKNERYMSNPDYLTAEEMLKRGFLGGMMKYNVWNKIVRRTLYSDNGILFPEGHPMGEDMTMILLAASAERVAHVQEALYHYVKLNENAYSNTFSRKKLDDIKFNVDRTISFLEGKFGKSLEKEISLFKLSIKLPFLITDVKEMYKLWEEWYPEANKFVNDNPDLPRRTRLLQQMAAKGQWWYVKLYYKVVYKFVYGYIFK